MSTSEEIANVMVRLAAAYPSAVVTELTIEIYIEELADLDTELLAGAAKKCRATCKWFPTISELRDAAVALSVSDKRSGAEAWGDVLRAISEHGYPHGPGDGWDFQDLLVGRVVRGMGWRNLCMSEEGMADRAHFIKSYEQERDMAFDDARLPPDLIQLAQTRRAQADQIFGRVAARLSAPKSINIQEGK